MDLSHAEFLDAEQIYPRMDLRPTSPCRPADWRWARSLELVLGIDRFRPWMMIWCVGLIAFSKLMVLMRTLRSLRLSLSIGVSLAGGWNLRLGFWLGRTDEEIADRLGLSSSIVAVYVSLFFVIREKLEASDWIMAEVLGLQFYERLSEDDFGLIWKFAAFQGGPEILDALITRHDQQRGVTWNLISQRPRRCDLIMAVHCLHVADDPARRPPALLTPQGYRGHRGSKLYAGG